MTIQGTLKYTSDELEAGQYEIYEKENAHFGTEYSLYFIHNGTEEEAGPVFISAFGKIDSLIAYAELPEVHCE